MVVGIVIDVFIVRSILMPSLITVPGTASGWPRRALRRRPALPSGYIFPLPPAPIPGRPSGQPLRAVGLLMLAWLALYAVWSRRARQTSEPTGRR